MARELTCQEILTGLSCAKGTTNFMYPPEGDVLSPYVIVEMQNSGRKITVGNESAPSYKNEAMIVDFEFGWREAPICRFTVMSVGNSSFKDFMAMLITDFRCQVPDKCIQNMATLEFGWIWEKCDGSVSKIPSVQLYLYLFAVHCHFQNGKFLYEITASNIFDKHIEARANDIHGEEGKNEKYFADAVRETLTKGQPHCAAVSFDKVSDDGQRLVKLKFANDDGDPERGMKGVWRVNGTDKLNACQGWIGQISTQDNKSVVVFYDCTVPNGGQVRIIEDTSPPCKKGVNWSLSIGTYVVNGGKCSPVIEFNPKFDWSFVNLFSQGGGWTDHSKTTKTAHNQLEGVPGCTTLSKKEIPNTGAIHHITPTQNQENKFVKDAAVEAAKSRSQQLRTYNLLITGNIEADLVIVGDPNLTIWGKPPNGMPLLNRPVQIVFLNPFNLRDGTDRCGFWVAEPPCNDVISNRGWLIKGVTHKITGGKFHTILNLRLPAPGSEFDVGSPLGGPGSGGWTPPGCKNT